MIITRIRWAIVESPGGVLGSADDAYEAREDRVGRFPGRTGGGGPAAAGPVSASPRPGGPTGREQASRPQRGARHHAASDGDRRAPERRLHGEPYPAQPHGRAGPD